jgi:capsular polysaccharide export protein
MELGNIKGKLFADPEGTNAYSKLYRAPSILDHFEADAADYEAWQKPYLASKEAAHVVPQAKTVNRSVTLGAKLRRQVVFAANTMAGVATTPKLRNINRLQRNLQTQRRIGFNRVTLNGHPYVFFPMQVRIDAQALLHSDMDMLEAVSRVDSIARTHSWDLLVKPHPAESDPTVNLSMCRLRDQLGFKLVDLNTFHLLKHALEVYTVNSTVGLEALILGKPVTFLGRSMFASFVGKERYLRNYIMRYLIDVDFFSSEPVSHRAAEEILARADV